MTHRSRAKKPVKTGTILEFSLFGNSNAGHVFPEAKIVTAKDPTVIPDGAPFDGVFASHVLEHISYWKSIDTLAAWAAAVKPGGTVHVLVPSLEWAAEEIQKSDPSKALVLHLFGGQTEDVDVHKAGFTMRHLRACFEQAGMRVFRARTAPYMVQIGGVEYAAEQHYVAGVVGEK